MSYTNTTPNYDLPQFEASDRMTPVADFNGAFSAIDAALKANADNIADMDSDVAEAKSDAESALTTANSVASTANNALLQAQTANTTAGNALSTANGAVTTANSAKATAEASAENLADEFDSSETYSVGDYVIYESVLYKCTVAHTGDFVSSDFTAVKIVDEMGQGGGGGGADYDTIFARMFDMTSEDGTFTPSANITNQSTSFKTAFNSDKSLGKIYGLISVAVTVSSTTDWVEVGTLATNIGTFDSDFYITGYSAILLNSSATVEQVTQARLKVTTTGTVTIEAIKLSTTAYMNISLPPCILHFEDFGD